MAVASEKKLQIKNRSGQKIKVSPRCSRCVEALARRLIRKSRSVCVCVCAQDYDPTKRVFPHFLLFFSVLYFSFFYFIFFTYFFSIYLFRRRSLSLSLLRVVHVRGSWGSRVRIRRYCRHSGEIINFFVVVVVASLSFSFFPLLLFVLFVCFFRIFFISMDFWKGSTGKGRCFLHWPHSPAQCYCACSFSFPRLRMYWSFSCHLAARFFFLFCFCFSFLRRLVATILSFTKKNYRSPPSKRRPGCMAGLASSTLLRW